MKYYNYVYLVACLFCISCGGNSEGSPTDPNEEDPGSTANPSAALLVFPEQNSECTTGSNLTSTQSTIVFNWDDASNATSYELFVKNLSTQDTQSYLANTTEKSVTILRGTPYSWYVVSKNSGTTTAQSATWKFYNAGEAVSSYAPFPAELLAPNLSEIFASSTTNVTLEWKGTDVDNDITVYDIFFGTSTPPTQQLDTTSNTSLSVSVSSGNTYYWRIITYDEDGHNSESQIFQFSIE